MLMETEKHSAFLSGTIQTYIPEKRYGFIRCGDLTFFFHQTAMDIPFEPEIGKAVTFLPSGYPDTAANLLRLLERQIGHFNRVYSSLQKGMAGERNTAFALRSVEMRYPVLYNVLLEEEAGWHRFSAESDVVVLTNRAVFLVEIKNYGGKGDVLRIAPDGQWTVCSPAKRKTQNDRRVAQPQQADFRSCVCDAAVFAPHSRDGDAGCSGDCHCEQQCPRDGRKRRRNPAGAAIRNAGIVYPDSDRIESMSAATADEMAHVQAALESASRPARKYEVIDYRANIQTVCGKLTELLQLYRADCARIDRAPVIPNSRRTPQKVGFAAVTGGLRGIWKMIFNR